ncbi:SCO0930 family lipoprotein [Streptomyces uncialis]|uniref:SCO0930 family lipoprotein n=1 Tax=Streptomyces uncialis TaxID=1048205 RepID=UPI00386ED283|nr:SCO0930 family lipoprotein [Streptomyces uncialis]
MKTWRSASFVACAAVLLALTTACGQDSPEQAATGQNVGAVAPAGGGAGASPGAGTAAGGDGYGSGDAAAASGRARAAGRLAVWDSKELGRVVTDSAGLTLYRFDKDTAKPPRSDCAGECAVAWPPVPADGATAPTGVDVGLLGEVVRADGVRQLTLDGWPMYRYVKDGRAGDAKGQGVGGVWFAAAPDGKKAAPAGGGSDAAGRPGLSTRVDPKLGEIVVDKDGMTVYRFTKDSAWPMRTACIGECLEKWPVVAPVDKAQTKGIKLKGYVTFGRPDGIDQQTIDCWPLYTFAADKVPGDTKGQGVGGTWFAVKPDGKPVKL